MQRIIVTDLTHFKNQEIFCTAGIDPLTQQTIRPMPYLSARRCRELNLLPGAVLKGMFTPTPHATLPHIEDCHHEHLSFNGHCSEEEFRRVLADSANDTVPVAFGVDLPVGQKFFPIDAPPQVSLATVSINPANIEIVRDQYDATKIKAHFSDSAGNQFRFLSIADLGFFEYAKLNYGDAGIYNNINTVLWSQREVFLRIGLGRAYQDQRGRNGFWMQVNGIYSFPEYVREARQYV